jgi:hypothetical protein
VAFPACKEKFARFRVADAIEPINVEGDRIMEMFLYSIVILPETGWYTFDAPTEAAIV